MGILTYSHTLVAGTPENVNHVQDMFNDSKAVINGNIDSENMATAEKNELGLSDATTVRRGKSIIPTSETTSATSYAITNLTTPDRVSNLVLPTDGLIFVAYQAIWQNSVVSNSKAAIFVGANQLKSATAIAAPTVQEATGGATTNDDDTLSTCPAGLAASGSAGTATEVTTGQIVGCTGSISNANNGFTAIFAAAGTYDITVQFKNVAAGSLTVKNRHLWVWTMSF